MWSIVALSGSMAPGRPEAARQGSFSYRTQRIGEHDRTGCRERVSVTQGGGAGAILGLPWDSSTAQAQSERPRRGRRQVAPCRKQRPTCARRASRRTGPQLLAMSRRGKGGTSWLPAGIVRPMPLVIGPGGYFLLSFHGTTLRTRTHARPCDHGDDKALHSIDYNQTFTTGCGVLMLMSHTTRH